MLKKGEIFYGWWIVLSTAILNIFIGGTYFYGFNSKADVVSDVRVRRAMSMAIDRQSLIDNVTKGGQEPAQWLARSAPTYE